jgi:hypothetical protein
MKTLFASLVVLLLAGTFQHATAQDSKEKMIAIYNVSTGKHLDFLKWMAESEAVDKEAGLPATQWYVHHDGAGWDYISISMVGSPTEQEANGKKVDELRKKKGMPTGMAASLKFRQFISNHSDTYSGGPYTAEEIVKMAEAK